MASVPDARPIYIYTLSDPETGAVRYVGKAANPKLRLSQHITQVRHHPKHCHRHYWLRGLLDRGLLPILRVIEEATEATWEEAERRHIASFRAACCDLVNNTDGGEGPSGTKRSEETRRRMSEAQRKHHAEHPRGEETRRRIARANTGRVPTDEARRHMSAAQRGRKHSPEDIEKSAAKRRGRKQTPEHIANHAAAIRGRKQSPEAAAKSRIAALGKKKPAGFNQGSRNGRARISEEDVPFIRLLVSREIPRAAIAEHFGVSTSSIANIAQGRTWAHIPQEAEYPQIVTLW